MSITIFLNDRPSTVRLLERRPLLRVAVDDREYCVLERSASHSSSVELQLERRVFRAWRYVTPDSTYVRIEGRTHIIRRPQRDVDVAGAKHGREIRAQMPGTVVEIHCAEGDAVTAGDKLVTTESMKLQCTHIAPRNGVVERIICSQDAPFDNGAVLILLAADDLVARPSSPARTA